VPIEAGVEDIKKKRRALKQYNRKVTRI